MRTLPIHNINSSGQKYKILHVNLKTFKTKYIFSLPCVIIVKFLLLRGTHQKG
jgi:hypothetical protein